MSCCIESDVHISTIANFCPGDSRKIAKQLYLKNVEAFSVRYYDSDISAFLSENPEGDNFKYSPKRFVGAVQVYKLAESYNYQACECEDWTSSIECAIVADLMAMCIKESDYADATALRCSSAYKSANWSI